MTLPRALAGLVLGLDSLGLRLVGYSIRFRGDGCAMKNLWYGRSCETESLSDHEAGQFPRPQKDAGEHGAIETAGVGVSPGWVIGGQEMKAVGEMVMDAVREGIVRFACDNAGVE